MQARRPNSARNDVRRQSNARGRADVRRRPDARRRSDVRGRSDVRRRTSVHGRSDVRRRPAQRRRPRRLHWGRFALTMGLLAMLCFGVVKMAGFGLRAFTTSRTNAMLVEIYAPEAPATAAPTDESVPHSTVEPAVAAKSAIATTEIRGASGEYHSMGEMLPAFGELYAQNSDVVAWLKIPDVLSLPVVYRDNEYYLDHDYYGRQSESGTVFLDVLHPLSSQTQYMVLHGHAMFDGNMFGLLTHYRHMDYVKEHPYLTFTTLYEEEKYEIFGVLDVTEDEMVSIVRLGTPQFAGEASFQSFISGLRAKALHFTNDEVPSDAAILALSTCWKDGRIVVLFKRVEE